jgi:hypothetical protein
MAAEVQRAAEAALYRYLNPFIGGPGGDGWPFGRDLHLSEIFGLLQRVPYVEFVETAALYIDKPGEASPSKPAPPRLALPKHGLFCSSQHKVTVR